MSGKAQQRSSIMNIKTTISKIVLVIFIITNCAGQAWSSDTQSITPYDSWTHLKNLEEKKAFATLATFLETMLEKIAVAQEKNVGQGADTATTDLEGMTYLLDDLAEVYTTGIINFQKALAYNKRALEAYEKIKTTELKNIPISEYFNQRRMLYYYFYPLRKEFEDKDCRELKAGERYFYNKKDFATFFQEDFLNAVRERDLEELKHRINNRKEYLNYKLGIAFEWKAIKAVTNHSDQKLSGKHHPTIPVDLSYEKRGVIVKPLTSGKISLGNRVLDGSDLDLELIRKLLEKENIYNTYYKNFYLAGKLWFVHKKGGRIDYSKLVSLCQEAIAVEKEQRLKDDMDSYNLFKYWLGLSYLKLGDSKEGTHYIRSLLKGIDEMDDFDEEIVKKRRLVMGKAVEEKKAGWETFSIILGIAGSVAGFVAQLQGIAAAQSSASNFATGSYRSMQELVAAQQAGQQSAQNILQQSLLTSTLMGISSQTLSQFAAAQTDTDAYTETKRLAELVSPLVLKVGRYLDKFEQVELYTDLGRGYERLGKNIKAIRYYEEALSLIEIQRSTISTESQRISFFAMKENLYKDIIRLLIAEGQNEKAFEYVERAKARAFLDILAGKTTLVLKTPEDTAFFSAEMARKEEISSLLDQTKLGIEQIRSLIVKPKLASVNPALESLTQTNTITAKEALLLTKGDFSILEYFISDKELYILLLDRGKLFVKEMPIDKEEIFKLVSSFRNELASSKKNLKEFKHSANMLYKLVIEHVRGMITAKRLFIVSHSWFHYIPFQALSAGDRYFIEEFAITYVPSVTILKLAIEKSKKSKEPVLILSNPHISSPSYKLYSLPYAEDEALSIQRNFKNSTLFFRQNASETSFKENAPKHGIIHLAAHAFFDKESPLSSAILLAGDGKNDGVLTAAEIYQTNLNAYLVVLSACETGLTYVSQGDELIGFTRALMYSGADSVLSSLWNVDDKSTAHLMKLFYENLKTFPKDIAFQKAQVEVMKTFPHPYNWSPFILTGSNN